MPAVVKTSLLGNDLSIPSVIVLSGYVVSRNSAEDKINNRGN